ncbi:DUF7714 family protein [Methanolobus halotolerans]|uniref:Uncharacterized protein n=1 Tax=Methanolobus halotolerans TaxID=2052935 RepID=A0A4E0PVF4_9EURY|nr:hypothetical protein [Methanolobus halotolerans]TGC08017.1 hypothetical protein CUN85_10265 [Methanolobus halotolerans]
MIFPDEYKYVGMNRAIPEDADDRRIYFLTKYLIVEDIVEGETGYSLYSVQNTGEQLLRDIANLEKLASGEEIIRYDKELNIKDRTLLIETAHKLCEGKVNTVIFTGIDKHVTFVHKPDLNDILDIEIVDVVPPEPSWLASVLRRLEESGMFGDLTIRFSENLTDLRQFEGENTVFPCSSSGLKGKCLDCDVIKEDGSLLVGCEISRELFESRFPDLEYSFINICPFKSDVFKPAKPFITRCCRSEKSGIVTINGIKGAVVHWGASEFYVANTIWELVKELRERTAHR